MTTMMAYNKWKGGYATDEAARRLQLVYLEYGTNGASILWDVDSGAGLQTLDGQ
jgi:hypothetical protein